ncbi:exopolysaccharide biosynthesis protein [Clostridium estertheticum]|uniref:tyrosine-protein phosphatase n=1 Tax=Clostridium estertheticum TaxID=238834 RepID=UPI001CF3477C|nr:CpsB/CapC family capsule biosynthesis tyrosine phosphatase [Clostridium estertheticum]MCB2306048.1 exopolysaccharide biosynthesis protein [Clostridium estertheticum]MCB2346571.1 exopolysaccharide biosynthesis protein [Clostridium estertheticum]MCB2348981.1 exopolysaccharide biosynthesis protein [Clostridium estertheticum]WAG47622.1 exopolysaccharide biosynthesis protein [Clostridium estertheticum]
MIDIHSHILPGIDDGSKDMETSIKMLKMAEEKGTKTIVATPHYIRGRYENHYEKNFDLHQKVKLAAKNAGLKIEVLLGQEVMLDKYALNLCREKKIRGINESSYMLVEFPMDELPNDALDLIYELRVLGIKPIIAHPERYEYIIRSLPDINDFINEGCLFQINAGSLQGVFGKQVQKCAKLLVKEGLVNFIASDAHSINIRCPGLIEGVREAVLLDKDIEKKVSSNLELMLIDKDIEVSMEKIKKKKSIFQIFKR